ncbi:hypothetical protein K435DRAFT_858387 [Dendrothele bispora CBS 962.96]|uniref:Uncharacterized protein n=1 Tax=Dendrothele bispora (strain CBS 962.96) TaxID=1314807 RepID=A0A4S8M4E5_DENBC|nr:hypothetical protein K435DRAFT_858387 [Dendrothele bispora CBS 962.96]
MEEGHNNYRRRLEWMWYCICKLTPEARPSDREQVWRTLVESEDIWSIWKDGDDLNLQVAPMSLEQPEHDVWKSITPIISEKIDRHSENRCTLKLPLSPSPVLQNTSVHMHLAIVLWKTLLATRRVKYPRNPSSVNCEIPSLIPKWWDILPELVKANLVIDNHSWDRFRVEQKHRGHSCMEDLPEKEMWSTWVTVQTLISTSIPPDIPLNDENCLRCLELQKQPFGRPEIVKPHVLALWYITEVISTWLHQPCGYLDNIWDSPRIFSPYASCYKDLDLRKSLLNQVTLHRVDEWLMDICRCADLAEYDVNFQFKSAQRKHIGKTLDHIPAQIKLYLKQNEDDLEPHWTAKTQTKIPQLEASVGSESESVEPASWVSAVVLFTLAKIYGLGPLTADRFMVATNFTYADYFLKDAPLLFDTPPYKKFHEALKRSGHTCCGKDMDLFDHGGEILLGYGPKNEYSDDCDSESDLEEETQSSSLSRSESSIQSSQPVFNQENVPSLGCFESEGQTTLLHPPHPPSYSCAFPESASHLQPPLFSQPPILNQQSWADYTIQPHTGSIRSTDLCTMPHLPSQEIQNEQAGIQDSDPKQHIQKQCLFQ